MFSFDDVQFIFFFFFFLVACVLGVISKKPFGKVNFNSYVT